ncbi:Golgin subfamily A member 7/ERF4 family-domain-containing protein [Bipolaris maydis]|nr:Golgin subfamily A member 7/ERF4 family-domain-containing protein [Bipolaris maydis]
MDTSHMQSSLAPGNMATPTGGGAQESPGGAGAVVRESAGLTLVSYFVYLQDKAAPPSCTRYTLLSPPLIAVTEAWCGCRAKEPLLITAITTPSTVTTTTPRSPPAAYPPPPASPVPARWSLTNRIFTSTCALCTRGPPRLPAARLWNPKPLLPTDDVRDEYPLLTLPEQRLSRQSPVPSSLAVERSTADNSISASARTSIGLPRPPPRSLQSPSSAMPPEPHPDKDVEAGRSHQPGLSRASLPGSRRSSIGSGPSASAADEDEDGDAVSELPWGPSHPCFPHPNPHVPLDSELYNTTRIIRIKRDWMVKGDLAPTFANLYPEILDPLVTEDDFRILIKKINDDLIEAFDHLPSALDAGFTGVKKKLAQLERWIEDWNHNVGAKEAVKIIPLRRTGYLTLDIQIPDPHLGPDTGSRPQTQEDGHHIDSPQQTDPYPPYPITPTLQVNSQPATIGANT